LLGFIVLGDRNGDRVDEENDEDEENNYQDETTDLSSKECGATNLFRGFERGFFFE
jgi:hypothetical protein